ncbi:ferritin-like domain-containing protein [Diplogelasinospora grovesii]|uniref:Ferritin-like domain-containing protein n=1 Tax=Diplogelasinospora grovesii TaxID=303347 RepID=A0AAN6N4H5_9PEZI|nr:ferritin-like domain-containing protein [Diplogelasinospora grovesii]
MTGFKTLAGAAFLSYIGPALAVPVVSVPTTTFQVIPTFTPPDQPATNVTSHGPYTGPPPTTTGALSTAVLAPSVAALPPGPDAYNYPSDGQLHAPQPAPYTPSGGLGTNGSAPVYRVLSDFDYESVALALYQEWIELDLFHWGLATFSVEDFENAGLTAEDRFLIEFMADQELGHATLLSNILGAQAPVQCNYNYPVSTVREFIDFCQKLTRFGESGVYGFLPHLNARDVAQLLLQSISTEARQQMIFRQFEGLFPMPVWFEAGVPQSWAWTLLAPYISSCPAGQTRLIWQNFPSLYILNQPNPLRVNGSDVFNETTGGYTNTASEKPIKPNESCLDNFEIGVNCAPAVSHNRSAPLSYPGRQVFLQWDNPGNPIGPNNSYITNTTAGAPRFAAWVSQLNVTYTPLLNISGNTAYTIQPNTSTFAGDPAVNGTIPRRILLSLTTYGRTASQLGIRNMPMPMPTKNLLQSCAAVGGRKSLSTTASRGQLASGPHQNTSNSSPSKSGSGGGTAGKRTKAAPPHKTQQQLDEELKLKMEGLSGDGGASGIEYEDGKPVAMRRSVRSNMFRYI